MADEFDALLNAAEQRLKVVKIRVYIQGLDTSNPTEYELVTKLPVSRNSIRRAEAEAQNFGSATL